MKNIANCKPSEFLRQTNRIRKSVEKWLTATDIMNIRKRLPAQEAEKDGMDDDERAAVKKRNKEARDAQAKENLSAIFDAILEDHPDETLEVLALCCFVEPEDVDIHPVNEYLGALAEIINDEAVRSFFISLGSLARIGTRTA